VKSILTENIDIILFLIFRQKYIETILEKRLSDALKTLRSELAVTCKDMVQFHKLSTLLLCKDETEMKERSKYSFSRYDLINDLQKYFPDQLLIPEDKLEKLLSGLNVKSLVQEKISPTNLIPRDVACTFNDHQDEVWHCQISPNGLYLATSSKDQSVHIYSLADFKLIATSRAHDDHIIMSQWNSSSKFLTSIGQDKITNVINVQGEVICKFNSKEKIGCCSWITEDEFVVSSEKTLRLYSITSPDMKLEWKLSHRIQDFVCSKNCILIVCHRKLYVYNAFGDDTPSHVIDEKEPIACLYVKDDFAMVHFVHEEKGIIHLWNLKDKTCTDYTGHMNSKFVVRGFFNEQFVVCGSEDGLIYFWDRSTGQLLEVIKAHSSIVNCLSPGVDCFASVSDDQTCKIWKLFYREKEL
jgi:WD40 repeat protein